jgi:peptidoglycan-N-acetylglucosamine deacetylase
MELLSGALRSILGYWPAYMRPPYFATNDLVLQTLGDSGFHVIQANIDTDDYDNDSEDLIQNAVNNFVAGLDAGGSIELSHDVHQWTANILVQAVIDNVKSRGLTRTSKSFLLGRHKLT